MVVIDADGPTSLEIPWLRDVEPRLCIFEFAYIARPDSRLYGREVHEVRCRMGELLALQAPAEADMVMGVPESGVPAAEGFARASGIPYGQGLVKNRYIGRSFIAPGQRQRADAVRRKLNPLAENIAGKRLVVVDDSIVRGTTQRSVIRMLREAGAAEVHLRISSPPWRWPCFYGIDTPSHEELLATDHTVEDMARILGADSLAYITIENLKDAIGADGGFCDACFTGNYPTPVPASVTLRRPEPVGGQRPPGRAPRGLTIVGEGGATYAGAGVDIAAGDAAVERLRGLVQGIGGFGGQFPLDLGRFPHPVLVASTDGVGTKMVVAHDTGRYDTVGIDLVAMCVDDLVCVGAEPLFMLDYIATGKVDPDQVATMVAGVHEGCRQAGCALIGGETAEHAGVMAERRARPGRLRRRRRGAGDPARPRAGRAGDAVVGCPRRAALERLHAGPPRAVGARRPRAGRSRLGGRGPQRGRRAAAPVGDLHARPCWRCGRRWATPSTPAPTSPAGASSATCRGSSRPASARCSTARPGRSRRCSPRSSASARSPRTRWTGSSTAASVWPWWSTPAGRRGPAGARSRRARPPPSSARSRRATRVSGSGERRRRLRRAARPPVDALGQDR